MAATIFTILYSKKAMIGFFNTNLVNSIYPIATNLDFKPIHFGIMMISNMAIGSIHRQLGVILFYGPGLWETP